MLVKISDQGFLGNLSGALLVPWHTCRRDVNDPLFVATLKLSGPGAPYIFLVSRQSV